MRRIIYTLFILSIFFACSTKKSGMTNRTYHRVTSWFNTIYNGNVALENDLKAKEQSYQDNFSTIIKVEPINPFTEGDSGYMNFNLDRNTSVFSNAVDGLLGREQNNQQSQAQGLDRVIEKSLKAIEDHSILIKGKEYNSMLAEAYLLLGRAYYYKKQPFESMNYLNYMNSTLVKNRKEDEAQIYIAMAQAQAGNSFQANELFEEVLDKKLKKQDIKLAIKSYSQFLIDEQKYGEGIAALEVSKKYNKNKYDRGRYNFIQGQLSEKLGKEKKAIEYYQNAYDKRPSPELEIKSQIALSHLFKGNSASYHNRIGFLKKLTRQGLYQSRKNELYYAMAVTSLKVNKENEAMEYLQESLKESISDPQIRALAYQTMGDIYFNKPDYVYAGAYYDSAVVSFMDHDMRAKLESKNKALKEVIQKYYLVKKNDSILTVAKMAPEQRNEYYQKYIDRLKEKEEKERKELERKAEEENYTVFQTETLSDGSSGFSPISTQTSGNKWYFYNNSLKQNGQSEFKRLWGNRALADNWRMGRKTASLDDVKSQLLGQEEVKNPRRFEVEYYTEKLPQKPEELRVLKMERDTAELALGIMYYDKLHDAKSATTTLEHLISTPPHDEAITLAAMFNIYRFNKDADPEVSKEYADKVTSQYPNSKYAENILNPSVDIFKAKSSDGVMFYEEAYKKYEEGKYEEVKEMAGQALEKYPTDEIVAKFSLLSVFCDARLGDFNAFMDGLERISIAFENKEEGKKATELLNYFREKEKQEKSSQPVAVPQQPKKTDPINSTGQANQPAKNNQSKSNQQPQTSSGDQALPSVLDKYKDNRALRPTGQ